MLIAQDAAAVGANATFQQVHTSTALIAISCDLRASKEFELCHHLRLESGLLHHRPRSRQSSVRRLPCGIAIPRSSRRPPCRIGHVCCRTTGVWPALLITPGTGNRGMCQRWLGVDGPAANRGSCHLARGGLFDASMLCSELPLPNAFVVAADSSAAIALPCWAGPRTRSATPTL